MRVKSKLQTYHHLRSPLQDKTYNTTRRPEVHQPRHTTATKPEKILVHDTDMLHICHKWNVFRHTLPPISVILMKHPPPLNTPSDIKKTKIFVRNQVNPTIHLIIGAHLWLDGVPSNIYVIKEPPSHKKSSITDDWTKAEQQNETSFRSSSVEKEKSQLIVNRHPHFGSFLPVSSSSHSPVRL